MQWKKIAANWERMSVVARERWRSLTSADTELVDGNREDLIEVLARRYKWDRERAESEVQAWQDSDTYAPSLTRPNRVSPKDEAA